MAHLRRRVAGSLACHCYHPGRSAIQAVAVSLASADTAPLFVASVPVRPRQRITRVIRPGGSRLTRRRQIDAGARNRARVRYGSRRATTGPTRRAADSAARRRTEFRTANKTSNRGKFPGAFVGEVVELAASAWKSRVRMRRSTSRPRASFDKPRMRALKLQYGAPRGICPGYQNDRWSGSRSM